MPVVVVLDEGARNASDSYEKMHVLNISRQRDLYPDISTLIPLGNYGRKNIGYMYALDHLAACRVWDFDDDNCLTEETIAFLNSQTNTPSLRVHSNKESVVNPYLLYGASEFIWPRGYPVQHISKRDFPRISNANETTLQVVQVMQNVDPDVDAIWRLQHGARHLPMTWDSPYTLTTNNLVVGLSDDTWAPFNAQATLLNRDALPFAYLPCTVHGRVSDIWRSYILQYFLGTAAIGFSGAFVSHFRNSHNYMADFEAEQQLFEQTDALIQYLRRRPKDNASSTNDNYVMLINDLYSRGFVEQQDVIVAMAWARHVSFNAEKSPIHYSLPRDPVVSPENVIAVLHLNSRLRSVAPLWMALHGHHFKRVEIYVPRANECRPISGLTIHCISDDHMGFLAYESMVNAIERTYAWDRYPPPKLPFGLLLGENADTHTYSEYAAMDTTQEPMLHEEDVKGFVFIHDDAVWHPSLIPSLVNGNQNAIATPEIWTYARDDRHWTHFDVGIAAMERFLSRYRPAQGLFPRPQNLYLAQSDLFYVISRDAYRFARIGRQMRESGVFLEIAVPTILQSFTETMPSHYSSPSELRMLRLWTCWDRDRLNPAAMARIAREKIHQDNFEIVHPVKMSTFAGAQGHLL
jgi:hypothetical protein